MITTTLFKVIQSELIKRGHSEFETDTPNTDIFTLGRFVFYDQGYQFTEKIMNFDEDVQEIVDFIFHGMKLEDPEHDNHFKKMFLYRFVNRYINRQTIDAFKMQLMGVLLENKDYIERVYRDSEKFIEQAAISNSDTKQSNNQVNDSETQSDNRQAYAELPQSTVNLDVENAVMASANDNTVSRNKQKTTGKNTGQTTGSTKSDSRTYNLDTLIQSSGLMESIMIKFDEKCFLQIW